VAETILHNEPELFRRITEGDAEAFRQVYVYYFPRLYPFVFRIVKDGHLAEEIIQQGFTTLWEKRDSFTETTFLGAWLYKVVTNLCLKHLQQLSRERRLLEVYRHKIDVNSDHTQELLAYRQQVALIERAVSRMPPQRQRIYRLSRQEGWSHREIATNLRLSARTVNNQLVKALKFIEDFLRSATAVLLIWLLQSFF
jgi:RNA polymerase sigma-70 factor (family 1)